MTTGLLPPSALAERIEGAVAARAPFSFVRLGDGEGALLAFNQASELQDYSYLAAHFGPYAQLDSVIHVRDLLADTINHADVVGVRDDVWNASQAAESLDPRSRDFVERFREAFPLREAERHTLVPHDARRIFQLWRKTKHLRHSDQIVVSPWAPIDLQMIGFWDDLIATQSEIGLINLSPKLADRLSRRFPLRVDFIQVPGSMIDPGPSGPPSQLEEMHVSSIPSVSAAIPENLSGKIFFIAAGLIGKHYASVVKRRGGIAIDIGALADVWDGRATRPLVYASKLPLTASRYAPPPRLLLGAPALISRRSTERRLILHLGLSKTGTTSIQQALHANEAALAQSGVRYLLAGRHNGAEFCHHELARAFGCGERRYDQPPPPPVAATVKRLTTDIDRELQGSSATTGLISSELFTNFTLDRTAEDDFLEWLGRYDVSFVFYVRQQFDWLVSWYTQAAKNGNMGLWLDEFLAAPDQLPNSERFDGNFLRKIEYFERYFGAGAITVRSYDKEKRGPGLVPSFFRALGVGSELMGGYGRLNATPPDEALIEPILRRRLQLDLASEIPLGCRPPSLIERALLRGPYQTRRDELRAAIENRFRAVNDELQKRYGVAVT